MNKKQSDITELLSGLASISQLGLSVALPIGAFALLATYLRERFNIPDWLVFVLVLVGIAAGINSFVMFIRSYLAKLKRDDAKEQNKKEE